MATVTTPLTERAESIFTDLGYTVSKDGTTIRAERKWRVVHVTVGADPPAAADGDLHCFVTWDDSADEVRERIANRSPDYEWAVIGIEEDGDYDCYRDGPRV